MNVRRTLPSLILGCMAVWHIVAATAAPAEGFFTLKSGALRGGAFMAMRQVYTAAGGANVSPDLHWSGPPAGTKSFAITVFDPDARGGAGWWHWLELNIPASARELPAGAGDPALAAHASTIVYCIDSFGNRGYSGPCPPPGDSPHHYVFTVYALNIASLSPAPDAQPEAVSRLIAVHTIGKATLVGRFGR